MARGRKKLEDRKKYCLTLKIDLAEKLNGLSESTRIAKSHLLDEAVTLLIDKYESKRG